MRVEELDGSLLNFWVAKAADMNPQIKQYGGGYQVCRVNAPMPLVGCYVFDPIINWAHAGPIIEKHKLTIVAGDLVTAFRDFVAAKFGPNVSDNLPN